MVYKTHRGREIDMEALRRQNEDTVAVGNMGVNARGDKLGPGGTVVQTVQRSAKTHYDTQKSSTEAVSIKGDAVDAETVFPEENKSEKATKPRKKRQSKETETASGDIIIEEETDENSSNEG
jgi:hypothetical protein